MALRRKYNTSIIVDNPVVGAFNQEKALVRAFSVIVKCLQSFILCLKFQALYNTGTAMGQQRHVSNKTLAVPGLGLARTEFLPDRGVLIKLIIQRHCYIVITLLSALTSHKISHL